MKVLIVGHGVIGTNLHKELLALNPHIYDKYKVACNTKDDIKYDFAFICVDTPGENCDTHSVVEAIKENKADIYIIKSTVLPGTTIKLAGRLHKKIVFSPEYYGGTQHCNNFNFNFTILGGPRQVCLKVQQLLQHVYDATHTFHITDATTAELVKYMENSWLATKVSFCNEFAKLAKKCGIDYEELRELFILDPRVNPSHTFVYSDKPYWDSHCLNKDVPAIANYLNSDFLKFIVSYNTKSKS